MDSHDSGSQTCSKRRGKVTSRDEAFGPTMILINTVSGYFSLLGFETQQLSDAKGEQLVVGPQLK